MRIVEVREKTVPISSSVSNAYIDFSKMTCSVAGRRHHQCRSRRQAGRRLRLQLQRPLRPGRALIRERFRLALCEADPIHADGRQAESNLDPVRIWSRAHAEREARRARGALRGRRHCSTWQSGTRSRRSRASRLWRLLADRYRGGRSDAKRLGSTPAGGYYYPGKDLAHAQGRDARVPRARLRRREDEDRRRSRSTRTARRIEAVLDVVGSQAQLAVDANGRFDLETAHRLRRDAAAVLIRCSGTRRPGDPLDYALQAEARPSHYPVPMATGENLFCHQDARQPAPATAACARTATGCSSTARSPTGSSNTCGRSRCSLQQRGWSPQALSCPHGGHQMSLQMAAGLQLGGNEAYPGVFQPFGKFADGTEIVEGYIRLPELPGIGFEANGELYSLLRSVH